MPPDNKALREAAWRSHLENDGGPVLGLAAELGLYYAEEIARLGGDRTTETARDLQQHRLVEYLMLLVLNGAAPIDLLEEFLQRASDELRRRGRWFVGNQVSQPKTQVNEEVCQRGRAYWEMRLAAAKTSEHPDDFRRELGTIDDWCFHGMLDELWLSSQLLETLAIGIVPNNGYHTVTWLAKLAINHVDRAVEVLFALVQRAGENRWLYMTNQTPIRLILSQGRDRGNPETASRVSCIVNNLASLGENSYLDLDVPRSSA